MNEEAEILNLNIPEFSDNTNWDSAKTRNDLENAMTNIGFVYYAMNESDKKVFARIVPKLTSFFESLDDNKRTVSDLPDYNENMKNAHDYGYGDRAHILNKEFGAMQAKFFVIPMRDNISCFDDERNPFKTDSDIKLLANNMIRYAQSFFVRVLQLYLRNNFNKQFNIKQETNKILGEYPRKSLRFNYYGPHSHKNVNFNGGIREHCDGGLITFLLANAKGLQVKYKNKWWNIPYKADRFIVNFGKALQITTNGKCKAAMHRVPIITNQKRISFGVFVGPDRNNNLYKYKKNGALQYVKTIKEHFFVDEQGKDHPDNPIYSKFRSKL